MVFQRAWACCSLDCHALPQTLGQLMPTAFCGQSAGELQCRWSQLHNLQKHDSL